MASPCDNEAFVWRSCLKQDDYNPDRDHTLCDKKKDAFHVCMQKWRSLNPSLPGETFGLAAECSGFSEKLHACMKLKLFQVEQCTDEMARLKECSLLHDPAVQQALKYESPKAAAAKGIFSRLFGG